MCGEGTVASSFSFHWLWPGLSLGYRSRICAASKASCRSTQEPNGTLTHHRTFMHCWGPHTFVGALCKVCAQGLKTPWTCAGTLLSPSPSWLAILIPSYLQFPTFLTSCLGPALSWKRMLPPCTREVQVNPILDIHMSL